MDPTRISAIPGPADAVLPEAAGGFLGVLMLDTRFPRPPGDVGHPATFAADVRYKVIDGAWPRAVVTSAETLKASTLPTRFVDALHEFEDEGAFAITTSCGFLVLLQRELQGAARVPVVSSSLLLLPSLLEREGRVGVLTISAVHLTADYLRCAGVTGPRLADVVVQGVDGEGEFARAILGNRATMDLGRARDDVVAAALLLKSRAPDVRSVVLECTNMPPYAQAVRDETGFELFDLRDALATSLATYDPAARSRAAAPTTGSAPSRT
ncbi:MAG TPA: aspartate/glutamate racemase family protein [Ramlibacter sp.]|uniref:aspartate/glutamate racemase family protein n=1 Tax=Ramlibacter sp. TaxID=1917967 RepID=UPI002BB5EBED|nr:aspartate/glutamate racemase family protein [Ramlibacter sp.]HVZ42171.1 aspartate/glutamate racemase family protein [Ramlibacter sp.]